MSARLILVPPRSGNATTPSPATPLAAALQAVQAYLGIEEVLERLDSGQTVPADATWRERLLWVWRCHLHYWVFRWVTAVCVRVCTCVCVQFMCLLDGRLPPPALLGVWVGSAVVCATKQRVC